MGEEEWVEKSEREERKDSDVLANEKRLVQPGGVDKEVDRKRDRPNRCRRPKGSRSRANITATRSKGLNAKLSSDLPRGCAAVVRSGGETCKDRTDMVWWAMQDK